ncbi:hypothetical protein [Cellulosimicrobium protaetiae]|uniref:Uncharacterized protein n=1 Tax=Cellulosimicrobium protaetiae TaxID=2587808 RepID=A0A6M5UE44_9MICO|nr:hypothetical protein [Cellulosimicrobium protaetiae]QJW35493.1 hypothetical protein FIC82_004030 [Cellulosimicrobium protaetiae]
MPTPARAGATKAEVIASIAQRLGFETPVLSTGSTEPRSFFAAIDAAMGLGILSRTKQGMAREIVQFSGASWESRFESAGATVTLDGLRAVAEAVETIMLGRYAAPNQVSSIDATSTLDSYPGWAACAAIATSRELELLREIADLAEDGVEAPTVGEEACDGVPLSLAWPGSRLTVEAPNLGPELLAELRAAGWVIVEPIAAEIRAALTRRGSSEEV